MVILPLHNWNATARVDGFQSGRNRTAVLGGRLTIRTRKGHNLVRETQRSEGITQAEIWELPIISKVGKERIIYFDQITLEAIVLYLALREKDDYRPLFLQHHRSRDLKNPGLHGENYRLSLVGIWSVVHKYGRMLGVELKPHDFRHNLATTLLNADTQLSEVQGILGHASPATTKIIYSHYNEMNVREVFSRFRTSCEDL